MRAFADRPGVFFQLNDDNVFDPKYRLLHDLVAQGAVGRVRSVALARGSRLDSTSVLKSQASALENGGGVGGCYDSKRDRIYISGGGDAKGGGGVYIYDVKTNAWSNPPDKPGATRWPGANTCCVHHDAAADRVLAFHGWNSPDRGKGGGIAIYDPQTGSWEAPLVIPANVVSGCVHGFYSSEVNAHFIYTAHDSDDRGTMWVYRYKRAWGGR